MTRLCYVLRMGLGRFSMRALWIAVLLAGAVLALAPSSALAHAGHSHSRSTVTAHHKHAPTAVVVKAEVGARLPATKSVSVAVLPATPADAIDCDGQGCCTSGPCTGYHGFVLTTTALETPSLLSTLLVATEALPPGSADLDKLRRPPKSFA